MAKENKLRLSQLSNDDRDVDELVVEVMNNRFDHRKPLPPEPEWAVKIDGKGVVEKGGSLISVLGLPKTRKSSVMGMIAAAGLSIEKQHGIIETPHINGKILWMDTEMGLYREVPRFHNHVIDMAERRGKQHDDYLLENYHVTNFRPYSHEQRLAMIDRMIVSGVYEDVGAMFLDGVADLMSNTNEAGESKAVLDRLLMWADKLACPLFVALHLNQSASSLKGKGAGFAGNYLANKGSYTIIAETEYDGSPSTIKAGKTRNGKRFKPFKITNIAEGEPSEGRPIFYDEEMDKVLNAFGTDHGDGKDFRGRSSKQKTTNDFDA